MKFMGSKRFMLGNGLGEILARECSRSLRVVDLFCGSGAVSWYVASRTMRPVVAVDIQEFAVALARSALINSQPVSPSYLRACWLSKAERDLCNSRHLSEALELDGRHKSIEQTVKDSRDLCTRRSSIGPTWNAYGGYYFSPLQALKIDHLVQALPQEEPYRSICLASLIHAIPGCIAAPGHTAQPFAPTVGAGRFIEIAWKKDPITASEQSIPVLAALWSVVPGEAQCADAIEVSRTLEPTDLVIVDPPYSEVQYSRFYHVLETVARGKCGPVSGSGRYPPVDQRPQSPFSRRTDSSGALDDLLENIASCGARAVVTFPANEASNGTSGSDLMRLARKHFVVEQKKLTTTRFSTLGGNNKVRSARVPTDELILVLSPT